MKDGNRIDLSIKFMVSVIHCFNFIRRVAVIAGSAFLFEKIYVSILDRIISSSVYIAP